MCARQAGGRMKVESNYWPISGQWANELHNTVILDTAAHVSQRGEATTLCPERCGLRTAQYKSAVSYDM